MEPRCPVCNHKDVNEINRDMVLHAMAVRKVGEKYNISPASVAKHRPHITRNLALAVERREISAADRLLEDTEMLWRESQQALEDSKSCVKTMAITEGHGKGAKTVYKEYKDVGAVLAAIKVAHENRRLFGDATGAIKPAGAGGQVGIYLSIAMPRMDNTPPSIEATVLNTEEIQEGDPESPTKEERREILDKMVQSETEVYDTVPDDFLSQGGPISTKLSVGLDVPVGTSTPTLRAKPTPKKEYVPIGRWTPGGRGRPPKGETNPPPKPQTKRDNSVYLNRNKELKASIKEKIWGRKMNNGYESTIEYYFDEIVKRILLDRSLKAESLLASAQETIDRLQKMVDHYAATQQKLLDRMSKLEEKLKLAKLLLWRETDEAPITILDVD